MMAGSAQRTMRFLGLAAPPRPAMPRPHAARPRSARPRSVRPPRRREGGASVLRFLGLAETPIRLVGHPRIRERAIANLRRRRRRDHLVASSIGAILALALLAGGVLRSPLLAVEGLAVVGLDPDQAEVVRGAVGVAPGANVLDIDLAALEAEVEALPWVRQATATRRLPATLVVRVADRRAVAAVDFGGATYLLDAEGVVLERVGSESTSVSRSDVDQALPRIVVARAPVVGTTIDEPAAVASAAVAAAMPPALDAWVIAYEASPAGDVDATLRVATDAGPTEFVVNLGRPDDIAGKAATVAALVQETIGRGLYPTSMDVRIPDRPVVRS